MNPAQVAVQALGTALGRPFLWDGRLQGRNTSVPDVITGTGAPSSTTVPGQAKVGSLYINNDGSGAGMTHLYYCTVAGSPGTWIAIA